MSEKFQKEIKFVAEKYKDFSVPEETLIKAAKEALQNVGDDQDDSYYLMMINHAMSRAVVDTLFPSLNEMISNYLENNKFDEYYKYFYIKQLMINIFSDFNRNEKAVKSITEAALEATTSDPEINNRNPQENIFLNIPYFKQ